jgi:NAD(P)-dependent dehydrogenase (short-subunit alcohol dehydrogenase family)
MKNPFDFSGKVALVTGAASGMGLATAQAFAEAGAAVVLADFREDLVQAETQKLVAAGYKAVALRCDVSDDAQVAAMVDRTVTEFGRRTSGTLNASEVGILETCASASWRPRHVPQPPQAGMRRCRARTACSLAMSFFTS